MVVSGQTISFDYMVNPGHHTFMAMPPADDIIQSSMIDCAQIGAPG
jgi:hypothetical protein